ncbi:hypothetical protein [Acinetobacter sp.]|uniref:hypothetical protein n=1 Tax=Acinetobacter sp. TaxID=472 RepID=UPI00388E89F5
MISFKQFLQEEDVYHKMPKQAAEVFLKHCTQWNDVDVPLYRLTRAQNGVHAMRTRSTRVRASESQGGSREIQKMIFAQPGWEGYPDRTQSIFCSTKKEFVVGDIDEYGENLVLIYPFDGTKIAMTTQANDFNFINLVQIKQVNDLPVMHAESMIQSYWAMTINKLRADVDLKTSLQNLKENWLKDGKFDPTANGNEKAVEVYEMSSNTFRKTLQFLVEKVPEVWTPEFIGCELVTPATINLPGKTREAWFTGKYLSIPYPDWKRFKEEVKALQTGTELPPKQPIFTAR